MKILVTGAAGFIGSHVCDSLLEAGNQVIGIDNFNDYYSPERKRKNIAALDGRKRFSFFELDFTDRDKLNELFEKEKPQRVIHLGAMANVRYSVKRPDLFIDNNITGTANLLEFASKHKIDNFVFASTSSIYGQREDVPFIETDNSDLPLAAYPASKKAGELLGHAWYNMSGMNFSSLRFFNVYGPNGRPDMMPWKVIEAIKTGKEITLFNDGEMYRDWTYIGDIVSGVIAAVERPLGYQVFNLGCGEPHSMKQFMKIYEKLAGKEIPYVAVDAPKSEPIRTFASIDKAKKLLDYNPRVSLEVGLTRFWEWYQENLISRIDLD